jgi:preprotein translocase subunit SecB
MNHFQYIRPLSFSQYEIPFTFRSTDVCTVITMIEIKIPKTKSDFFPTSIHVIVSLHFVILMSGLLDP